MDKHTPGPWTEDMIGAVYRNSCGKHHNRLMVEIRTGDFLNENECMANAALIIAAPDLLDALKQCINPLMGLFAHQNQLGSKCACFTCTTEKAQAAIAKATYLERCRILPR